MGITIATNVFSLKVLTELSQSTARISARQERLSSGLRINSAKDDPAGLALADSLGRDARIASSAIRNTEEGLSIAAIQSEALYEVSNILNQMAELANAASNTSYTDTQRSALSNEFIALGSEINRISTTTEFNNINLLNGTGGVTLQVGLDSSSNSQISLGGISATLSDLGIGNRSGALTFSIVDSGVDYSVSAASAASSALSAASNTLTTLRGEVAGFESRLNYALSNLETARENFTAAENRIREIDAASELTLLIRDQVIQQSGIAMFAQANLQPQRVLELLQ